jgi:NAD(P)-dependent dehydrogenase (short-subunit alcohol dehydrogenase family)
LSSSYGHGSRTWAYKGLIEADAAKTGRSPEDLERDTVSTVPIRRANDPEDIGHMAVFLASARSRNITGQSFNIDGGLIPD